jgi:hypothetical protein
VDVLLTPTGFAAFRKLWVPKTYAHHGRFARRFLDPVTNVTFDILLTGLYPGTGEPGPIVFPDPDEVSEVIDNRKYLNLPMLIQLKLAARRHQDFADVVNLIRFNDLDERFQERLHSTVRGDYIECLEEKRREDIYAARLDAAVPEPPPKEERTPRSKSNRYGSKKRPS